MKLKYYITIGDASPVEVQPTNNSDFGLEYTKPDDRRFSYIVRVTKSLILNGLDFKIVYANEQSPKRCQSMALEVHYTCNGSGTYSLYKRYIIKLNRCIFDLDRCTVEIPLQVENDYHCYDENKKMKLDLLALIENTYAANIYRGTVEFVTYTSSTIRDFYKTGHFPEADPVTKGWMLYEYSWTPGSIPAVYNYKYAREKLASASAPDASWVVVSSGQVARPVPTYYRVEHGTDTGQRPPRQGDILDRYYEGRLFTSLVVGYTPDGTYTSIDNGMLLTEILQVIATNICGKTFKSNFFQVNPDGPFSSIYPDLNPSAKTQHILVYQKSDVKRPNATANATIADITPEKFIADICNKFNCGFIIDENNVQIEHVSYFRRAAGLNTLLPRYARGEQAAKYSYENTELPEKETFEDVEQYNYDFVGVPILYQDDCAVRGTEAKTQMEYFTTDMEYVLTGGVRDAEGNDNGKINEDGFVIAATELIGGTYYLMREQPILDDFMRLNNPFGWAQLHRDYFKYDRPQAAGLMNNIYTLFASVKPNKKGEPFDIVFCCDDVIKLTDYITTKMGQAIVGQAQLNLVQDKLTLLPLYEQTVVSFVCLAPTQFSFVKYEGGDVFFNIAYQDSAAKDLELEIRNEANEVIGTNPLTGVLPGEFNMPFDYPEAVKYYFRVRIKCTPDDFSLWSNSTSGTLIECNLPFDVGWVTYMQFIGSGGSRGFMFSMLYANAPYMVEAEVNRPDNVVFTFIPFQRLVGANIQFVVPPEKTGLPMGPSAGLYKFRFRFSCSDSQKGPWSDYKNVTL